MAKQKGNVKRGKYLEWITKEGLLKIEGWARDGLVDKQIAQNIGVSERTLTRWKEEHPSIMSALKRGKEVVDRQVENALLKRALGYQYDEVTKEQSWNEREERYELTVTKIVTKEVQPDTTAQIFWLKNRKPTEWRDKQDVEHSGNMNVNNAFAGLTTEELRKLANKNG